MSTPTIRSHYCGQTQPHSAHVWQTPPTFGTATVIFSYQCAGTTGPNTEVDGEVINRAILRRERIRGES